jgi:hypothetical protein
VTAPTSHGSTGWIRLFKKRPSFSNGSTNAGPQLRKRRRLYGSEKDYPHELRKQRKACGSRFKCSDGKSLPRNGRRAMAWAEKLLSFHFDPESAMIFFR